MHPEPDPKLEALIDAELKKLPPVSAPQTLAPRVMSLLAARAGLPWWQRAWWDWPLAAKTAFVVAALVLAAAFGSGSLLLDGSFAHVSPSPAETVDSPAPLWGPLGTVAGVGQVLWDNLGQPYLLYFAALAALAYLVCAGAGTMFIHVAVRRN